MTALCCLGAARAAELIGLDLYEPRTEQYGFTVSLSGRQVAWSRWRGDRQWQVEVADVDHPWSVTGALSVSADVATAAWGLGERLYVQTSDASGATFSRADLSAGTLRPLAAGRTVGALALGGERIAVLVEAAPASSAEFGPSEDPSAAEAVTVYADVDRFTLRSIDPDTGDSRITWTGRDMTWLALDDALVPHFGARWFEAGVRFDGERLDVPSALDIFRIDERGRARHAHTAWDEGAALQGYAGGRMHLVERREGRSALVSIDSAGRERVVLMSPGPDLGPVWLNDAGQVTAVSVDEGRRRWWFASDVAAAAAARFEALGADVLALAQLGGRWFGWLAGPTEPGGAYVLEEAGPRRLGPSYGAWEAVAWRPMEALTFRARDGLPLTGYLTTPSEEVAGPGPWPLVVVVHGGPWNTRDAFRYNPEHQRYADLGYAALSVNFRGSGGFGAAFEEASRGEWGEAMQTDLLDGLAAVLDRGLVDPSHVAIVGDSYGGYAALMGLTTAPGVFACGVAGAAPGALYGPDRPRVLDEPADIEAHPRIGDHRARVAASPVTHAADLQAPLLVWHGALDRQVPIGSIRRFVDAAVAAGAPITFAVFPEGRHGLERVEDQRALSTLVARFLAGCLGGRAEPW